MTTDAHHYSLMYNQLFCAGVSPPKASGPYGKFIDKFATFRLSQVPKASVMSYGLIMMQRFLRLKLIYPIGREGYVCRIYTVTGSANPGSAKSDKDFKSGDTADSSLFTVRYASAYWRRDAKGEVPSAEPEYVCMSATFESKDGEYRRQFRRYEDWIKAHEATGAAFDVAEAKVQELLVSGAISISECEYPAPFRGETAIPGSTTAEPRLAVPLLVWVLADGLRSMTAGMLPPHVSAEFATMLRSLSSADPDIIARCSVHPAFRPGTMYECGQKIAPLTIREVMHPGDYRYTAWRELAVTQLAGDLVINFVTPAFAVYNQWTYIEGADPLLFQNASMRGRYERGSKVEHALKGTRATRRELGDMKADYLTGELSARLYDSVEYAQSHILMAPMAILHTESDVGRTLLELRQSLRWFPRSQVGGLFPAPACADQLLFDYVYGAHCLHSKVGVAHTDLHSNNMTIYLLIRAVREVVANQVVVYVTGERGESTYIFPKPPCSTHGCLIDFSRCILGPLYRKRLEEFQSQQYATNFYRDQIGRVMKVFARYAPELVARNQEIIKAAVLSNFEHTFDLLCTVDFISIGASASAVFAAMAGDYAAETGAPGAGDPVTDPWIPSADPGEPGTAERARWVVRIISSAAPRAARLEKIAREMFVRGVQELISGKIYRSDGSPGQAVMRAIFEEYTYTKLDVKRTDSAQIVDMFNYNNELKYSGSDYSKFPPWANIDKLESHLGKDERVSERDPNDFFATLGPSVGPSIAAEQIRAEQEKLDGPPMTAATPWLGE